MRTSAYTKSSLSVLGLTCVGLTCALALGCAEDSNRGPSAGASSTAAGIQSAAPLMVVATTPTHGAQGVSPVDTFYLTFSEDLDPASLASAIELSDAQGTIAAVISAVTPRVAQLRPLAALGLSTSYTLKATTRVLSLQGQPLAVEEVFAFTTSTQFPISGATSGTLAPPIAGNYRAGVSQQVITPQVGVPLAGFGGGARRHTPLPDFNPYDYHTFLNPSVGVHDDLWAKALVIDNGFERVAILTLDAVATDAALLEAAWRKAQAQGFTVPLAKVMACSSHTHSGAGAVTRELLWQVVAADLYVHTVFETMTDRIATALLQAEQTLGAAQLGVGSVLVPAHVVSNRRHDVSPNLDPGDVDPEMVVIRVDDSSGAALATVWNFAIHGTHFGASNLEFSADIMGSANIKAQAAGAGVCLFINGAEGDIRPSGGYDAVGQVLADAILQARGAITPAPAGVLQSAHAMIDMGRPKLSLQLHRLAPTSIAQNGFVQGLASLGIGIGTDITLPSGWMSQEFRFQAIRLGDDVIASLPGEAIHELGLQLKLDGGALGFGNVIVAGLANGHGAYFTSEREYAIGGYEGLASLFGAKNGTHLVQHALDQMDKLKP